MNKYLLIDFGNTCIKAGVFDITTGKALQVTQVPKTAKVQDLLKQFSDLNGVSKVVESVTSANQYSKPFNEELKKTLKLDIRLINHDDFKNIVDLSSVEKGTTVGLDILLLLYYSSKHMKESAIFSLGTVYVGLVCQGNKLVNGLFIPSISEGLKDIAQLTAIPAKDVPQTYDDNIGLSTKKAFSAGANILIEGYVDNAVKHHNIPNDNVIITGGDAFRFANINKKYKRIDNLVLFALSELVKDKGW